MKKIPFHKIHGNGNDFILIDNRRNILKGRSLSGLAKQVCHRNRSVGVDGLIVVNWIVTESLGSSIGEGTSTIVAVRLCRSWAPMSIRPWTTRAYGWPR